MPSQMLENWCWTKEGLTRLSKHVDTGATLPDDLLENMLRAKNAGVGAAMARQIYLGRLDLAIHGADVPADAAALQALVDDLAARRADFDTAAHRDPAARAAEDALRRVHAGAATIERLAASVVERTST